MPDQNGGLTDEEARAFHSYFLLGFIGLAHTRDPMVSGKWVRGSCVWRTRWTSR